MRNIVKLIALLGILAAAGCTCMVKSTNETMAMAPHSVYFAYDSAELDESSMLVLREDYEMLKDSTGTVVLSGHADERGAEGYNATLSKNRAKAVEDYLVSLGMNPNRIQTMGMGQEMPQDGRSKPEAWAKNRRVSISLQG